MELEGHMLDDFEAKIMGTSISIGIHKGSSELSMLKAENHNKFTARAIKTKVPKRRFIPFKSQNLRKDIMKDVAEIISEYEVEDE